MNPKIFQALPSLLKFYRTFKVQKILEAVVIYLTFFLGIFLIVLLVVQVGRLEVLRKGILVLFVAVSIAGLYWIVRKILKISTVMELGAALRSKSPIFADLLNGLEFSLGNFRDGVSTELAAEVVASVEKNLQAEAPGKWLGLEQLRQNLKHLSLVSGVLVLSAVFPPHLFQSGLDRLIFGLDREIARYLKISPEGGKVSKGDSAAVSVEFLQSQLTPPELWVQGRSGWDQAAGQGGPTRYEFILESITEPTEFKVRWKNIESRIFRFDPVEPPRLGDFEVTLKPPAYTGESPVTFKTEPQIHAYRGTEVSISARATKDLESVEIVSEEGLRYPVTLSRGSAVHASFKVQNPFRFWFDMKDRDGIKPQNPAHYSVTVQEDAFPQVQILAPSDDLLVGQEAKINFTFEVKDDLVVTNLYLNIDQRERGSNPRLLLKKYVPAVKQKIDEAVFSLSALKTHGGEILKMRLEVMDNDTVTGPKSGFSGWITLEIRSYEKEHEAIEQDLKEFRRDMIDLLSDQTQAQSEKTPASQSKALATAEKIEKKLGKALEKMERDPLSDYSVWSEHKALREGLQNVRQGAMEQARKALEETNMAAAEMAQEEAVNQIERLSSLSEEIHKYSKMRDLMHSADRLEEKGQNLAQKLAGNPPMSEALRQELQDTMKEAMKVLAEIEKALKDLPQELPEDFVNKPAVKEMNLGEMANSMESLSESIRRGDVQSALKAAQDLLKQAKAARETLAKAAEESSDSSEDMMSKSNEKSNGEIDKIVSQQEALLSKTYPYESKRIERQLEKQKKVLEDLTVKQKKAMDVASGLIQKLSKKSRRQPHQNAMLAALSEASPKMEKVYKELSESNVLFSQKWLDEVVQALAPAVRAQESFQELNRSTYSKISPDDLAESLALGTQGGQVLALEQEILQALKNPPKQGSEGAGSEEQAGLKSLGGEQESISKETEKLTGEITKMAQRSALVKPELMDAMKKARGEMKSSQESLARGESEKAVQAQEKALSHLRSGQEMMNQMGEQMGQSKNQRGQKQSGMIQPRQKPGGSQGFRNGVVKIPGADDYLPPKEFREEILDSLKEKFPKSEENLIKDYFKRLTR